MPGFLSPSERSSLGSEQSLLSTSAPLSLPRFELGEALVLEGLNYTICATKQAGSLGLELPKPEPRSVHYSAANLRSRLWTILELFRV